MSIHGEITPETRSIDLRVQQEVPVEEIDGELINDMFLTFAYNLRHHKDSSKRNRELKERFSCFMPQGGWLFRDWGLVLKVRSQRAGSLIMRHGCNAYLEEIEDGTPTVTGVLTSMNLCVASFCLDPDIHAPPNKDREVTVMPVELWTLERRVTIEVVSIGNYGRDLPQQVDVSQ